LNRTVQALRVQLVHTAPTGESYVSVYGHLSRVDVQEGVSISEGTVIGLSGNTGCRAHRICISASRGTSPAAMS
jgi:hypothetical protein